MKRFLHAHGDAACALALRGTAAFMLASFMALSSAPAQSTDTSVAATKWVGTWGTAPQLVEPGNNPPAPGLSNNTLRQCVRVSIGGDSIRIRLSNEFSASPVTIHAMHIARSLGGSLIDTTTDRSVFFGGSAECEIARGAAVTSDPLAFPLAPRANVALTIFFGSTSASVTGHPGSRTTSYLLSGNAVSQADFAGAVTTDHWYTIQTIDVLAMQKAACVAILGNSITDGRGSTTNAQNRWPDVFSETLLKDPATAHVGVLNQGIGGNCVLSGGLGPTGSSRFERDILNQAGVRWAIVVEGVNDIGGVKTAAAAASMTANLIAAYRQMIAKAHEKNIRIYGGTIMPFKGNGYYNQFSESCRTSVNEWIRAKGNFDACIDFDKAMRSPADTTMLVSTYQNDGLHPDAAGYKTMGESVDVHLFTGGDTTFQRSTGIESLGEDGEGARLGQNFPNPFNPVTHIYFSLAARSAVSLKIFDAMGREVSTLVSGEMQAGRHQCQWNAAAYPSGTYFYRLSAGAYRETKRLTILK